MSRGASIELRVVFVRRFEVVVVVDVANVTEKGEVVVVVVEIVVVSSFSCMSCNERGRSSWDHLPFPALKVSIVQK